MKLLLTRDRVTETATLGALDADGIFAAYTLELPVRDGAPGSAIPDGEYRVSIYHSPHFECDMPLVEVGQGRSEIEIHWLNTVNETRGCIGVGSSRDVDTEEIFNSVAKFNELFPRIKAAVESQDGCWLKVETKG